MRNKRKFIIKYKISKPNPFYDFDFFPIKKRKKSGKELFAKFTIHNSFANMQSYNILE